jgi:SP family facilitated glucose transporter-like MFS transporter 1
MIILHLAQQLSGINGIFYYSTVLYKTVGLSPSNAVYGSIGTSGILVVMTLVSVPLMDRAGRRTLMLTGLGLMIFFEILLTVMLNVRVIWEGSKYFSIISIVSTVAAFAIGPGSIPWFIPGGFQDQGMILCSL